MQDPTDLFLYPPVRPITPSIYFYDPLLSYSYHAVHLGHILTNNLDDSIDIIIYLIILISFSVPSMLWA